MVFSSMTFLFAFLPVVVLVYADEGRPAVHGLHPAAAWTWVRARPSARRRPEVKFVELTPSFVRFVTGEGVSFCSPAVPEKTGGQLI